MNFVYYTATGNLPEPKVGIIACLGNFCVTCRNQWMNKNNNN